MCVRMGRGLFRRQGCIILHAPFRVGKRLIRLLDPQEQFRLTCSRIFIRMQLSRCFKISALDLFQRSIPCYAEKSVVILLGQHDYPINCASTTLMLSGPPAAFAAFTRFWQARCMLVASVMERARSCSVRTP